MPRNYVKKRVKAYTPQELAEAIEKVKKGELTGYRAAQLYNIPMTTLHDHLQESTKISRPNAGRPTVIPLEDEKILAEAIMVMEKWGFGLSRLEIIEIVGEYVRANKIQTPFKNNVPGPDWFINFRKRHRLSIKKTQSVEYVRRQMTDPFVVAEYFELLENCLNDLNLVENPQAIWNLDETSLCLDPSRTKVVGEINKPCSRTTQGSGKENITVLAGASASGKKLPPLIVFKGKFVWDEWMADLNADDYDFEISYACSAKGWMETDIFYNYFNKVLIPNLGEERPVLIIYDGHSTHVDVRVVQLAIENQVTILKLPPHTSHLLQPMDLAVFKSFKATWDAKLVEWQRRNIGSKMPKKVFAQELAETWQEASPDIIKSGFKKGGIHPFNAHVIPVKKYDPDAYKRFLKEKAKKKLKNPKSLKKICIEFFNSLPTTNGSLKKSNADDVTLLSQISKSDVQTVRFLAKEPTQLPTCLRNSNPVQSQTSQNPVKINVTSIKIIKTAPQPTVRPQPPSLPKCTFEELVLRKIQQDKKDTIPKKKKRVAKGAEVITATMGKKILEEIEKTKGRKLLTKTGKIDKKKTTKVSKKDLSICSAQTQEAGPSGIKTQKKRKRQPSLESITSVSDIISENSDSDIADVESTDELNVVKWMDEYEEEQRSQKGVKYRKQVKRCENLPDFKILTNKETNPRSTKGKGVGKRSKGKENQLNKENKGKKDKRYVKIDTEDVNKTTEDNFKTKGKDKQPLLKLEHKDIAQETQEKEFSMKEIYELNDSVLVRYFIRKIWRYYIGFIEEIIEREGTLFSIVYLKTIKPQQGGLAFKTTKKKDSFLMISFLSQ